MKFTEDVIKSSRMCAVFLDEPACSVFNLALDEIERLQARVAELEVEGKQVCEWKGVKCSPPGFKQYWIYYPPHNVSYWISAIGKEDYIFCPTCGERIKYVESES